MQKNQTNLYEPEDFHVFFCVIFDCFCQSFFSGKETRNCTQFSNLLVLTSFLKFLFLNPSARREVDLYKALCTRYLILL